MSIMVMTGKTDVKIQTEGNGHSQTAYFAGQGFVIEAGASVVEVRGRDAYLDPALMKVDQGYVYRLDGSEFLAVRRDDGRVDFYALPDR